MRRIIGLSHKNSQYVICRRQAIRRFSSYRLLNASPSLAICEMQQFNCRNKGEFFLKSWKLIKWIRYHLYLRCLNVCYQAKKGPQLEPILLHFKLDHSLNSSSLWFMLTIFMDHILSWEQYSQSDDQEMYSLIRIPSVHYRANKSQLQVAIRCQLNDVYTLTS
jgi:hypothetical protein